MTRNPFRYLQYVTPEDFVGRWPLIESIAHDLTNENGDSHAIIAGQRCGKTSALNALAHQLRQGTIMESADSLALPLYIDFKAGSFDSAGAVFALILNRVYRQINMAIRQATVPLWPTSLRLGARWFERLLTVSELSQNDLEDGLGYILDQLDTPTTPVRLILLLDDIDNSCDQPWTDALYSQSRALICNSDLSTRLRLVLTGSAYFLEQRSKYSAPLCDVLKLHYLEAFDESGIGQLVMRAPGLPTETVDAVWRQSGGHPFLAQYLLYHLWEQTGEAGINGTGATLVDRMAADFQHKRLFELESWVQAIEMSGLCAYKVLSTTPDWVAEDQIIATVDAPASSVKRSLLAFCCHSLAIHDENWTHYKYTSDLFRTWFNRYSATNLTYFKTDIQKARATQPASKVNININTGGGPYIAGDVNTDGGGFIGHDENG